MKSVFKSFLVLLAVFVLFTACPNPGSGGDKPPVIRPGIVSSFFWGSWVRMDGTNEEWYVSDRDIRIGGSTYSVSSADTTSMTLSSYTVTKRTENMLTVSPSSGQEFYLFRKSGATAQVTGGVLGVGSTASGSARSLAGIGSIEVILENQLNLENVIETTTDNDGNLIFDDIITDDTYTLVVPVQPGVEEEITFEVTPEFDGEDIGNININQADQNFKVSYTLSSGDMWGYHYANTSYDLSLKVTNIGSADMLSADYAITAPAGLNMSGDSLSHILGTVRANGGVKELSFTFSASSFSEDFKDFEIPISIISVDGTQWDDNISLRIYRETMSIYVASESNEVQGVLISPDKASFPFKTSGHQGSISVPARYSGYVLALSGADYESETSYAMKINGAPLDNGSSNTSARINEPNNDETQATPAFLGNEYLGYLGVYDLDFYKIHNVLETEQRYRVDFNSMGGTVVASQDVQFGRLIPEPSAPTFSGYTFSGWYTDSSYAVKWDFSADLMPAGLVLYAKWERFRIIFDSNGGSLVSPVDVPGHSLVAEPAAPVLSGFSFAGWYTDNTYLTAWDFANDSVSKDMTLVAKWLEEFTISFDSSGGSVVSPITVIESQLISEPAAPVQNGYVFDGWYTDNTFGTSAEWDFSVDIPTSDMSFVAKWLEEFTVTFDSNGGSAILPVTVVEGNLISAPAAPTRSGFVFDGWYTDNTFATVWDFSVDIPTSDMSFVAKWLEEFTVTFDSNGGSAISPVTVVEGSLISTPAAPTRSGFVFDGWYTDNTFVVVWDFTSDSVSKDVTLVAKWLEEFTVTFDSNGGSAISPITVVEGNLISAPAAPTRSGFAFDGWYTDNTFTTVWDFASDSVTYDVTLVAKWSSPNILNPKAYWSFSNTLSDSSANKYDLTNHGAVFVADRKGSLNSALYFDGSNDYLSLHQLVVSESDINSGTVTISLWTKAETINTSGYVFCINGMSTSYVAIRQFATRIGFQHREIGFASEKGVAYDFPGTSDWMHIVLVLKSGTGTFYLNGIEKGSSSGIHITSAASITIGAELNSSGSSSSSPEACFKGVIDDIRIFDTALNESEIQALYNE